MRVIGYWFRRGLKSEVLHLTKWTEGDEQTVSLETACGAAVVPWDESIAASVLVNLSPTASDAARRADANQRAHACARCGARLFGGHR